MATLTIPESTYQRLKELAAARRVPLEKFLDLVADTASGASLPVPVADTSNWSAAFDAWIASHHAIATIAEDSRDVIYGDERD